MVSFGIGNAECVCAVIPWILVLFVLVLFIRQHVMVGIVCLGEETSVHF